MNITETVGIDISKSTFDAYLHVNRKYKQFSNRPKGFISFLRWVEKCSGLTINKVGICFEHTGLYSLPLACYLYDNEIAYSMVPAMEIKKSLGITRGKNDKVDAQRIAEYAYLRRDTLKPYKLPSTQLLKLQKVNALRARMIKQRAGYKASLKEYKTLLIRKDNLILFQEQERMIHHLDTVIDRLDNEIQNIINQDEQLSHHSKLITSVKGIGPVLAAHFLVTTNCFSSFNDGRKYACYAGVAPFAKQSGTSLNSKARVNHMANKKMKALLNLASGSAIQSDPELKAYYKRRIKAGKSKMSTLNIVRNKLINRVFAVVKRGTPYVPLHQFAA